MGAADELLFELIGALHDGVDNDDCWLGALDRLSDALGGAALFIGSTRRDGTGFELSGHQVDPKWIELVNGPLSGHDANPVFATVSNLLRVDPARTAMRAFRLSDLIDPADYHDSAIYREAIAPAGLEHVMVVVLEAQPLSAISMTLVRGRERGDFGDDEGRLAAAIGPHLLSAMRLRFRFAVARGGALILDCIDQPVLLLGEEGALIHANREGEKLLSAKDGIAFFSGKLRGTSPADTTALTHIVGECGRAARGASLAPAGIIRLKRPSGLADLVVRALPLAGATAQTFGIGTPASVALIIHDPSHQPVSTPDLIASGLGISKAEAAVAARIWEGDGVTEAADALGLSPNTVKTHLKTIYETTGVHRQAGLVRRIATLLADLGREPA